MRSSAKKQSLGQKSKLLAQKKLRTGSSQNSRLGRSAHLTSLHSTDKPTSSTRTIPYPQRCRPSPSSPAPSAPPPSSALQWRQHPALHVRLLTLTISSRPWLNLFARQQSAQRSPDVLCPPRRHQVTRPQRRPPGRRRRARRPEPTACSTPRRQHAPSPPTAPMRQPRTWLLQWQER